MSDNPVGAFGPSQVEKYVSRREFGRRMGISLSSVEKAIDAGRIKVHDVGSVHTMLDFEEAQADYEATRTFGNNNGGAPDGDDAEGSWGLEYTKQRAIHESIKAERAQTELRALVGELHYAEDVAAVINDMVAAFRAKILAIPTKLAPRLVGKSEIPEVKEMLRSAMHEALAELAEYDPERIQERTERRGTKVLKGGRGPGDRSRGRTGDGE